MARRTDDPITSVQCPESRKAVFDHAGEVLGHAQADVVAMAADLLAAALEGEETVAERDARLRGKMGARAAATASRRGGGTAANARQVSTRSPRGVRQVSDTSREVSDTSAEVSDTSAESAGDNGPAWLPEVVQS